jgi:hypothetical protein
MIFQCKTRERQYSKNDRTRVYLKMVTMTDTIKSKMPISHCSYIPTCIHTLHEGNNHIRLIIDSKMALRGADSDNDHYLMAAKVRERLSASN